ncbi:N-ethylmaleimide reductase [Sulfuritortus calidifontis]|uniref:N-ethylmaleimide reductase n=1 Tax=Sulfuritortus calidifontis TaxID=1914471 RepID=A0A4R3K0N1_9PROT|nr:alkene reductase [Sulfuritortus calidifontis]TCS73799.1 N-ethylmaleimide reductase [Sulfuritortus calidifontis]
MTVANLLSPLQLGPTLLKNRLVMAPLTRCRAQRDGMPTPIMAEYYGQRASAGLIISEATAVTAMGVGYPFTPGIWSEAQVTAWRPITEAVHQKGGRIFLQLWHVGRISHPSLLPAGATPVAPSAIAPAGEVYTYDGPHPYVTPRALEIDELPGIVEEYRQAARNALAAGFDGVEVHGANGYLLDQFLRDGSNRRTDAYGGSIDNRARLLMEVLEAVCAVWGSDRVGVRLSPIQPFNDMRDSNPEATFSRVVELLNPLKLAYLHITELGKDAPGAAGPLFDVKKLRRLWQGIYMTNHGYDPASADAALAKGEADLVAFGALYIANPDLAERVAGKAPLNAPDPATFYTGGPKGYTDYPFMK